MSRFLTKAQNPETRFFYEDPSDADHAVAVFHNEANGLTISICEERAIDSYNVEFEMDIALPKAEAIRLRDYLNNRFPK